MRILFTSVFGQGHIRPLMRYAKGLIARGHDVSFAAPEACRELVTEGGVPFAAFDRLSEEAIRDFWAAQKDVDPTDLPRIGVSQLFADKTARTALPKLDSHILEFRPDVIVRDALEYAAYVLARKRGVPCLRNDAHNMEAEVKIMGFAAASVDRLLDAEGLSPDGGRGLRAEVNLSNFPAGFDGDAVPADHTQPVRTTVAASAKASEIDWVPRTDKPLVYVTFGTVVGGEVFTFREVFDIALDAVRDLDVEVLVTTGPNVDPEEFRNVPPHVEIRRFVPQDAVLSKASAVVFHGGSGTLTGAFAAGVPMVVVPLFADQPWNAERVEKAGLGVSVTDRQPDVLREAIQSVLQSPAMKAKASEVAREVADMPGLDAALDAILSHSNGPS